MIKVKNIGNLILLGLGTLIIVPTLSILSIGLIASSILTIIAGLLRTFGIGSAFIQMTFWPGHDIPTLLILPVTIAVATFLGFIGLKSWKLMKRYIAFVRSPIHM